MLTLRIADGPQPLHDRVAAAVRRAILEGAVGPGDALPTALQVADALGVHRNTVLRAYRTLRDEGTIDLRAGRGAHVRDRLPAAVHLLDLVDELLDAAGRESVGSDEVAALVRSRAAERSAVSRPRRST
jgi:GntR family transcriptional regulator